MCRFLHIVFGSLFLIQKGLTTFNRFSWSLRPKIVVQNIGNVLYKCKKNLLFYSCIQFLWINTNFPPQIKPKFTIFHLLGNRSSYSKNEFINYNTNSRRLNSQIKDVVLAKCCMYLVLISFMLFATKHRCSSVSTIVQKFLW